MNPCFDGKAEEKLKAQFIYEPLDIEAIALTSSTNVYEILSSSEPESKQNQTHDQKRGTRFMHEVLVGSAVRENIINLQN